MGASINNEGNKIKAWALWLEKQNGEFNKTRKGKARLIAGYCYNWANKES